MEFDSGLLHRLYRLGYRGKYKKSFPVPEGTVFLLEEGDSLYLPSGKRFPLKEEQKDALPLLSSYGLVPEYRPGGLFLYPSDLSKYRASPIRDLKELTSYVRFFRTLESLPLSFEEFPYEEILDSFRLKSDPDGRVYVQELETSPLLKEKPVNGLYFNSRKSLFEKDGRLLLSDPSSLYLYPSSFLYMSFFVHTRLSPSFQEIFLNEMYGGDEEKILEFEKNRDALLSLVSLLEYHVYLSERGPIKDPDLEKKIGHFRKQIYGR